MAIKSSNVTARVEPEIKEEAEFEKAINALAERPKRIKTVNEQPWKDA